MIRAILGHRPIWQLLAWIPALALAVGVAIAMYLFSNLGEPQAYKPLRIKPFEVTPATITAGGFFSFTNGVCVKDALPVSVEYSLGLQRENTDPFVAGGSVSFVESKQVPLKPGCQFDSAIEAKMPATIAPGLWHIYATVVARGPQGEIQRLNVISNTFLVVAP